MSSNQNEREMAMALAPHTPIFKLNADCFEELFGWLSLRDLHSFGKTCKLMQKVAGYYFRSAYPGLQVWLDEDDNISCNIPYKEYDFAHININGFSDFIENIELPFDGKTIESFLVGRSNNLKSLRFYDRYLSGKVNRKTFARITNSLNKVDTIHIEGDPSSLSRGNLLKHCTNIKRLYVEYDLFDLKWLLQPYPQLEQLIFVGKDGVVVELATFFQRNPNVRHLGIAGRDLLANQHLITASNVQLDTLSVFCSAKNVNLDVLKDLYERKVFKGLHLYIAWDMSDDVHEIIPTTVQSIVEKVVYRFMTMDVLSMPFINLKELYSEYNDDVDMEAVAQAFVNLELVRFSTATSNHMFAFIHHSRKLTNIGVKRWPKEEEKVLNLGLWNKERGKLAGAMKVAIWINEEVFLATKEATLNKNYQKIAINQYVSRCWTLDFRFWY